jgi:hypothetical protein
VQLNRLAEQIEATSPMSAVFVLNTVSEAPGLMKALHLRFADLLEARSTVLFLGAPSAALAQTARSVASELGPHGLRANALAIGEAKDVQAVIDVALFLLSAEASYVTGVMLPVD